MIGRPSSPKASDVHWPTGAQSSTAVRTLFALAHPSSVHLATYRAVFVASRQAMISLPSSGPIPSEVS